MNRIGGVDALAHDPTRSRPTDKGVVMSRPTKAIDRIDVENVGRVRRRELFVPGFTNDAEPTHLTRSFLGMTALCGYYPIEFIGESPSGDWCNACVTESESIEE
jgi:hypothetical protein